MAIYVHGTEEPKLSKKEQFEIANGDDVGARIDLARRQDLSIRVSEVLANDPIEKVRVTLATNTPLLYVYHMLTHDSSRNVRKAAMGNLRFGESKH